MDLIDGATPTVVRVPLGGLWVGEETPRTRESSGIGRTPTSFETFLSSEGSVSGRAEIFTREVSSRSLDDRFHGSVRCEEVGRGRGL